MKNIKGIIAILFVIAIITTLIILYLRDRAKKGLSGDPSKGGIFSLPTSEDPNVNSNIMQLTESQRAQLQTACAIPTSRAAVERVYNVKCSDYGY